MCVHIVCVCACNQEYETVYLSDFAVLMIIEVGEQRYQSTTNLEFQIRLQFKYQILMLLAYSTFVIIESLMLVIQGIVLSLLCMISLIHGNIIYMGIHNTIYFL